MYMSDDLDLNMNAITTPPPRQKNLVALPGCSAPARYQAPNAKYLRPNTQYRIPHSKYPIQKNKYQIPNT